MVEKTAIRFDWRLSFYAAAGAVIVFSAAGIIIYVLLALVVILVLLVCVAVNRGRRLSFLGAMVVYCAASFALCKNYEDTRTTLRWFLWSRIYKAEILAQPDHANGEWKHVEWDGWGFAGAGNTVVYVVYNPSNSLAEAAKTHSPGVVFTPIPRVVPRVLRLENSWYAVVFYTETDWSSNDWSALD